MLSDKEKSQVRVLIKNKPEPDYMVALAASDDYARSEIAAAKAHLKSRLVSQKAIMQAQVDSLTSQISALDD